MTRPALWHAESLCGRECRRFLPENLENHLYAKSHGLLGDPNDPGPSLGSDEQLAKWVKGVEPFEAKYGTVEDKQRRDSGRLFGRTVRDKFRLLRIDNYIKRFAELWGTGVDDARARINALAPRL